MAFDQLIRDGVALANDLTRTGKLQARVLRYPAEDPPLNDYGERLPDTPAITLQGVLESVNRVLYDRTGQAVLATAKFTILEPDVTVVPETDTYELPDGSKPRAVGVDRGVLADDGSSFLTVLWLGAR